MAAIYPLPNIVADQWQAGVTSPNEASERRTTGNMDAWSVNAAFWDKSIGDGNDMYQDLVLPAIEQLAELKPDSGATVLDLATGNGLVARMLKRWVGSEGGGRVVASDGSPELLALAKARESGIEYEQLDLTDDGAVDAFAARHAGAFDVVTLSMAILELPTLAPLARAVPKLLRPGTGRFVAVNLHPAFSKPAAHRVVEILENPNTGQQETRHWFKAAGYLSIPPCSSQGIRDQPAAQTLFHRSLQDVLTPFLDGGEMAVDRLRELAFQHEPDRMHIQNYYNFPQFPMLVAFRLRRL